VVEAKTILRNLERTEAELKQYMVQMQCPIGILVTPERMWLYRDLYTSRSSQSVRQVGEFNVKPLWGQTPPAQPAEFEAFVQQWLEHLAERPSEELPGELREAVREHILPALVSGEVRAAHPR